MNLAILGDRNVEKFGTYDALIFEERTFTNVELYDQQARLAAALADIGVKAGERVAVMLPNIPEVSTVYGAVTRLGAVNVPMMFLLVPTEISHILADSEAVAIVTSPEFVGNVSLAIEPLQKKPLLIVTGDFVPEGALSFNELVASATDRHGIVDRDADDLVLISYTSGTTGRPKGVMLTHANMLSQGENSGKVVDLRSGDMSLGCLPLAHLFGFGSAVVANLFQQTIVLLRWFTPDGFFDAVERYRINNSAVVPTILTALVSHPRFDDVDWSSLRWVVCGAAPLPVDLADEFEKRTGARVLEGYGLTETSPGVSLMRADEPRRLGSCGRPFPNVEVKVVGDDGAELPVNEPGELCVRGANVMKGYYRMPEETAKVMVDGWFLTGDIARIDAEGYIYITERKKDLIIRGGFNIFPRDVEEVLHEHPGVLEAAVVGLPDARLGEEVIAFVVKREEVTAEELLVLCRERLAKYKTPKEIRFIGAMPKNAIGKILKKDLRETAKTG